MSRSNIHMSEVIRLRLPSTLFYVFCTIVFIVSVICFVSAFSMIDKPFPSFLLFKWPRVGNFSSSDWHGTRAGLSYMDRIVSADGASVREGPDVFAMARQKKPGTSVQYVVESNGKMREVTVPVAIFGIGDFLLVFFIMFLGGLVVFCLGAVVYVLKPNAVSSWVFFFFSFFLGTYMATGFEAQSTYRLIHLQYFVVPFVPTSLFHLCLIFPDRKKFLRHYPPLEYLIYVPAVILVVSLQINLFQVSHESFAPWFPPYSVVNTFVRFLFVICVAAVVILLIHSLFKATSTAARQRARMILFGVFIAFLPGVCIQLIGAVMEFNFPWNFFVFEVIFFPASIAYSIVRHNLFDTDVIIRRTVGYAVVTAVVIGAYLGVSLGLNVFVGKYQLAQSRAFPILFTLGIILVFNPLRNRIQALVDRIFFRKEYDYGAIVEKVGGAMTSLLDLGRILKRLTQTFIEDMFINTSSIMLLNPATAEYQVSIAEGERSQDIEGKTFKNKQTLMGIIETEKRELTKYDVIEDPKYKRVSQSCATDFEELHATLMVPLVFQDQVIGSLNLGEKKSGKSYNREDIDLLRTIANQGAVAIKNARLFQENLEKQRMEEELNIARDLQMSMLPATCPEIKGFQIAALSTPAREVGGDFFDFIRIDEKRLGLIVGDVTGKSVSGALVMSGARSVFRMLSEEQLTVGETMSRANRRARKDMRRDMFIALLYAVLNARDKTISLCSAGQTQPIHFSSKTGRATLVETEGDTFPLGILDEADYEETRLQLESGDRVIFYTDGIVEAMNQKQEMFGFERLVEVVQEARAMNADSLLKEILDRVNAFVGVAVQHDDLTAIVVSVNN